MYFLIDNKNKIIFGWSAKCGCSHIKRIFWFYNKGIIPKNVHVGSYNKLPNNIENYTIIIISRNPYKRLVSGFLNNYKIGTGLRQKWNCKHKKFNIYYVCK